MRLNLFNWPPVASHLSCFIAGLVVAQLTATEETQDLKVPPRSLIITLGLKDIPVKAPKEGTWIGKKSYILRKKGTFFCRIHSKPVIVLGKTSSWTLKIPTEEIQAFTPIVQRFQHKNSNRQDEGPDLLSSFSFTLEGEKNSTSLPLCDEKPEVSYG